jgi:signal recognition particle receptor subunit beta
MNIAEPTQGLLAKEFLLRPDVLTTALVGLIVLILIFRSVFGSKRNGAKADIALLLGPCDAGKTSLFLTWSMPGKLQKTVTSQSANRGRVLPNCALEIVDYPGHPRLWHGALAMLPRVHKIVYLIDSSAVDVKSVSENLYDLMVSKNLRDDCKLLICRNKTDSRKKIICEDDLVKSINSEIEKLRKSRAQSLDGEQENYLGLVDEDFDLRTHAPISVAFASSSVKSKRIEEIESFLEAA